ncbi:MAG: Uncharacterized protein AUREO_047360 [Aureobasidium pullulans]|nr:MAG: Uncharacterized protein AUREO_047360 [Aureobasidium pullulans]THV83828.1 hypothetical protein D6D29_03600 [Aureobasidium pullulans]THY64872.1 hypothetical protein D6C97_02588 [Aureobasidium pullulans]
MAPKRSTSSTSAAQRNQPTLSFGKQGSARVTKTALGQRDSKTTKKDNALLEVVSNHAINQATTADAAIEEQADAELEEIKAVETEEASSGKDEIETRARRITDVQIKKYWRSKEADRIAPRVHQQGLDVAEKVLREFDMSGQYGPCIGIARVKRWRRASTLGLNPPLEVLAVLLKEGDKNKTRMQRAHVDELMSSRFIET